MLHMEERLEIYANSLDLYVYTRKQGAASSPAEAIYNNPLQGMDISPFQGGLPMKTLRVLGLG